MVFIMSKCNRCNITIYDDTVKCPLCNGVLYDFEANEDKEVEVMEEERESKSHTYPSLKRKFQKMRFATRIVYFSSIVAGFVCLLVNCLTFRNFWWSWIVIADLVYACFTVTYSTRKDTGHRTKILIQALGACILAVVLDYIIGYIGWSFNFFIPGTVILITIAVIVLMAVAENWQNYIYMLIILIAFSLLYLIFIPIGFVTFEIVSIAAVAVPCLTLLWLVFFGDRAAHNEIKRRFHV